MAGPNRRNCFKEPEMKCWAYDENGNLCGQPVVTVDPQRGCTVCRQHAPDGETNRKDQPRQEKVALKG